MSLEGINAYVIDIEANQLYPYQTKVWTIRIKRIGADDWLRLNPYTYSGDVKQVILDYLFREENPFIIGHNYLGYDGWVLWKEFGLEMSVGKDMICGRPVTYFDTLYASQYFLPDREHGHSLKSWGNRFNDFKIDYRALCIENNIIPKGSPKGFEFSLWSIYMDEYCEKDCLITEQVFSLLYNQLVEEGTGQAFKLGQKSFYLMNAQAFTGFKFDRIGGEKLKIRIEKMILDLKEEVEPSLPRRKLKKAEEGFYTMPSAPYKQDGSLSSHMGKFIERTGAVLVAEDVIEVNDKRYLIEPKTVLEIDMPMNLEDQNALKDFFLENGWIPSLWNVKKDAKGKAMRDEKRQLIKTSPKIQENGKICPNLLELQGELPSKVVRFLSLRNRLGVLNGWLTNPRLDWDGRLSAGASGIASTHRQKHVTVVNVPKAQEGVLLGKEYRALFTVEDGNDLIGVDQSALEARCQGNWTYKYDNGESAKELIDGDIHCFSKDTEILTLNGWKTFEKLSEEDNVSQWNNGEIQFVKPVEIIWSMYKGEIINITNKKLDMSLTPNHRVIYKDSRGEKVFEILAENITNKNSSQRIPSSGIHNGKGTNLTKEELQLLIATQADGFLEKDNSAIRFCFVKERKIKKLKEILYKIDCEWTEHFFYRKGRNEIKIRIKAGKFSEKMRSFLDEDKAIKCDLLFETNFKEKQILINEIGFWDGTFKTNGDVVLDTTCKKTRDFVQTLCHLTNMVSSVKEYTKKTNYGVCKIYRVYISFNTLPQYGTLKSKIEKSEYNDYVGCVVVPSGKVLVKRNNCIFVSGNSKNAKAFYEEETKEFDILSPDFDKDCNEFKPFRSKSKNGYYGIIYGCSGDKLASTLGQPEKLGKKLLEKFWDANPALKKLKDKVEEFWSTKGEKKWIPGLDGRRLYVRSQHSLINLLMQSTASIIVDYSLCLFDMKMGGLKLDEIGRPYYEFSNKIVKRVQYTHDEYGVEAESSISKEISEIMEWTMSEAGIRLNLSVPLVGESKIGRNWKETH